MDMEFMSQGERRWSQLGKEQRQHHDEISVGAATIEKPKTTAAMASDNSQRISIGSWLHPKIELQQWW
ncbi:unnamed protein product [Microthlaspi erraticum]|uniref:Uncharacterized protein n=1 Tax=Microthlaspi erraticum TaxID=1685480 RepID=A0A6D2I6S1_9BRAS|nr:unnamed protein product [Microthlaspi erraticum]